MEVATLTIQSDNPMLHDLVGEDYEMFSSCVDNMLNNIDRGVRRVNGDYQKVSKLLALRWLLKKEIDK